MTLTLDPRYPVVWRSPTAVQLGVQQVATVENVTPVEERLLGALTAGASRTELSVIAHSNGASESVVDNLLAVVAPALVVTPPAGTVVIAGADPAAVRFAEVLAWQGVRTVIAATPDDARAASGEVAVIVGSFVIHPAFHGIWLRRDIPHLPLVLGGAVIEIGPLVEPGVSACLHCVGRTLADADPAWPAIASQLLGRHAPLETPMVLGEAFSLACRLVLRRLAGEVQPAIQFRLDARTGEVQPVSFAPHPDCGCRSLPL